MSASAHDTLIRCVTALNEIEARGERAILVPGPGGYTYVPKVEPVPEPKPAARPPRPPRSPRTVTHDFGAGVDFETSSDPADKDYPVTVRHLGQTMSKMNVTQLRALVRVILMHALSTRRKDNRLIGDLRRELSAKPTPEPEVTPRWSFMRAMILPFAAGVGVCLLALAMNGVIK